MNNMGYAATSAGNGAKIIYPHIIFKLKHSLYCVDSRYIQTITDLPAYTTIPDASPNIQGVFTYREQPIQLLNLRHLLRMPSREEEFAAFSAMLDQRKQDHIKWVQELKRTVLEHERFTLAVDPHKCAFGKWYDHFQSDNSALSHHMSKIKKPHEKLHNSAHKLLKLFETGYNEETEAAAQEILQRAENEYMVEVLSLLEDSKEIFRSTVYREMVLVLNNEFKLGMAVDEVLAVEELESEGDNYQLQKIDASAMILDFRKSERFGDLILELNIPTIVEQLQNGDGLSA